MAPTDRIIHKRATGVTFPNDINYSKKLRSYGGDSTSRDDNRVNGGRGGDKYGNGRRHNGDRGSDHDGGAKSMNDDPDSGDKDGDDDTPPSHGIINSLPPVPPPNIVATSTIASFPSSSSISRTSTAIFPSLSSSLVTTVPSASPFLTSHGSHSNSLGLAGPSSRTAAVSTSTSTVPHFAETISAQPSLSLSQMNLHRSHGDDSHSHALTAALITIGSISAFIILTAIIYLIFRATKPRLIAESPKSRFSSWKRKGPAHLEQDPPAYDDVQYTNERNIPIQRRMDALLSVNPLRRFAKPGTSVQPASPGTQRQNLARQSLLKNPAPLSFSSPPLVTAEIISQPPDTARDAGNLSAPLHPVPAARLPGGQSSAAHYIMSLSRQTSDAYDPSRQEVNRVSDMSSISSGFGDAQILVPGHRRSRAIGVVDPNARKSRAALSSILRFSWVTNPQVPGDRDTVYTATSLESAPRFRSIGSWVAQQTSRIDKQKKSEEGVPKMPDTSPGVFHQRQWSDDPAFQHHPGQEVQISKGSRIPSEILDKRTGMNRLA